MVHLSLIANYSGKSTPVLIAKIENDSIVLKKERKKYHSSFKGTSIKYQCEYDICQSHSYKIQTVSTDEFTWIQADFPSILSVTMFNTLTFLSFSKGPPATG